MEENKLAGLYIRVSLENQAHEEFSLEEKKDDYEYKTPNHLL